MTTEKILTKIKYELGVVVEMEGEHYKVVECRELIPYLGEPEGFKTVLEKITKVQ